MATTAFSAYSRFGRLTVFPDTYKIIGIFFTSTKRPLWLRSITIAFVILFPIVLLHYLWRILYYRPFDIQVERSYSYVIDFSSDGDTVASCGLDGPVQLWSYKSRRLISILPSAVKGSRVLKFMENGHLLAASGYKSLTLWNLKTNRIEASIPSHIDEIWTIDFSPDGTKVIVGGSANAAEIWDIGSLTIAHRLRGSNWIYSVDFSPDGDTVATGELFGQNQIKVWNAQTGKLKWVAQKSEPQASGHVVAFSPNGKLLAGGYANTALWDARTGQLLHTLRQRWPATSLAFSSDSRLLAVGSDDRDESVSLWNTENGTIQRTMKWQPYVHPMTFWHNDRNLATASGGKMQLWSIN